MALRRKGRHTRPCKTSTAIATATTTAATSAAIAVAATGHAPPAHAVTPSHFTQIRVTAETVPYQAPQVHVVTFKTTTSAPAVYTVQSGNSLWGIAAGSCHNPMDYSGLYVGNEKTIGSNPNLIQVGQQLTLDCSRASLPVVTSAVTTTPPSGNGKIWDVTYGYPNFCGDGDGDGWDVACPQQQGSQSQSDPQPANVGNQAQVTASPQQGGSYGNVDPNSYSGIEQCIISRESGGNSQVMNSTGHYGLFQFDAGTWAEGGGNPADFGHASVAEQQAVFNSVFAQRGVEPWAPSDGC